MATSFPFCSLSVKNSFLCGFKINFSFFRFHMHDIDNSHLGISVEHLRFPWISCIHSAVFEYRFARSSAAPFSFLSFPKMPEKLPCPLQAFGDEVVFKHCGSGAYIFPV